MWGIAPGFLTGWLVWEAIGEWHTMSPGEPPDNGPGSRTSQPGLTTGYAGKSGGLHPRFSSLALHKLHWDFLDEQLGEVKCDLQPTHRPIVVNVT